MRKYTHLHKHEEIYGFVTNPLTLKIFFTVTKFTVFKC